MSIFPKHVPPDSNVVLHVRFPGPRDDKDAELGRPVFPVLSASVRPPGGEFQELACWQTCFYHRPSASDPNAWSEEIAPGFRKRAPLLLIANQLQGQNRSQHELVSLLDGIRSSSHFYQVMRIPQEAPLGRYETVVETSLHGRHHRKDNSFWVERLEVTAVERSTDGLIAKIHNPSPESTNAVLVEFADNPEVRTRSTPLAIQASETICHDIQSPKAILFYADDTCWIPLAAEEDRYCLRNQSLPWLDGSAGNEIHLFAGGDPDDAYALEGDARQIWLDADGLHLRSEIRTAQTASTYDLMVERGLINELTGNQIIRGAAAVAALG